MPVLNKMVYNGTEYILGGGANIGEPLNLTVTTSRLDATITWEDNEIGTIPPTTFQKSELVRKIGSAPTSPSDGTLVVTETVKDTYKTTGYVDQGLTDGETYYYRVFSYSYLGGISYCDAVNVTPSVGGTGNIQGLVLNNSFNFGLPELRGAWLSNDGGTLVLSDMNLGLLYEYSLSSPHDLSTATQVGTFPVNAPSSVSFNNDGTIMTVGAWDALEQYTVSQPYHISGATQTYSIPSYVPGILREVFYSNNGNTIFTAYDSIQQFSASTAYNPTSPTSVYTITGTHNVGIAFNGDGTTYVVQDWDGYFRQYTADNAYNISANDTILRTENGVYKMLGLCYCDNYKKICFCSEAGYVYVYDLPNS